MAGYSRQEEDHQGGQVWAGWRVCVVELETKVWDDLSSARVSALNITKLPVNLNNQTYEGPGSVASCSVEGGWWWSSSPGRGVGGIS